MELVSALTQVVKTCALIKYPVRGACPDEVTLRWFHSQDLSTKLGQHRRAVTSRKTVVAQVQHGDIIQGFGLGACNLRVIPLFYPISPGLFFYLCHPCNLSSPHR